MTWLLWTPFGIPRDAWGLVLCFALGAAWETSPVRKRQLERRAARERGE